MSKSESIELRIHCLYSVWSKYYSHVPLSARFIADFANCSFQNICRINSKALKELSKNEQALLLMRQIND